MMGTKPSSASCATFLGVSHALVAPHRSVHSFSLPPSQRGRDPLGPRLKLINVPSVKG